MCGGGVGVGGCVGVCWKGEGVMVEGGKNDFSVYWLRVRNCFPLYGYFFFERTLCLSENMLCWANMCIVRKTLLLFGTL